MLAPLLIGLAGSFHCVGMCGALMMAIPMDAGVKRVLFGRMLLYHSGRILMYVALGILFGILGQGFLLAGFQKGLAIFSGLLLIGLAIMSWRFEQLIVSLPGFGAFTQQLKKRLGNLLNQKGLSALFSMGMLNGLLPCGMVYAALAGAIAQTNGIGGGIFMGMFGLGTLPLLLVVIFAGKSMGHSMRLQLKWIQPVLLVLAGGLLLMRGLNLDLSAFNAAVPKAILECH
jgi:sulfite exporter TauE/SafE